MALLGFLVFLDGHQVHRADFVEPLLQRLDLLRHGVPIRGRAARRHFLRRQRLHLGRPFVGKRDGDALAADVVQVDVIFLLDFARAGSARTCFSAPVPLPARRAGSAIPSAGCAARADFSSRAAISASCEFFPADQFRRLRVDLLALVLQPLNLRRANPESPIPPVPCARQTPNTRRAAARPPAPVRGCAAPAPAAAGGTTPPVAPPPPARPCFRSARRWPRRAAGADFPVRRSSAATCSWPARSRVSSSFNCAASALAFLRAFLFLRGQALDFKNHRLDFLVQQPVGILQRVEFAFARGDGHFLLAQFRLRLLQAGLQFRLLAQQRAALAARLRDALLQLRPVRPAVRQSGFCGREWRPAPCGLPWPFK